jgi:hypothetical protein
MSNWSARLLEFSTISFSNSAIFIRGVLFVGCFLWLSLFIRAVRTPSERSPRDKKSSDGRGAKDAFFSKQQRQSQLYDLIDQRIRLLIGLLEEDLLLPDSSNILCDQDGLKLESLGWWPHPIVVCNLSGVPVRKKRFTTWTIFTNNNSILRVKLMNFDWVGYIKI